MERLLSILPDFDSAIVCFTPGEQFNIVDILNLLMVKRKIKDLDVDVDIRYVQNVEEYKIMCRGDQQKVVVLVENRFDKSVITCFAKTGEEEPIRFTEILQLDQVFDDGEAKVLEIINNPDDKAHKLQIHQLWEIQETKETLLVNALIANLLLIKFIKLHNFVRFVVNHARPSIDNLYLTILDYLVRNHHAIGKKKKKGLDEAENIKGSVICIPKQGPPDFMTSMEGFDLYPKAHYVINFWQDGRLQVYSNDERDQAHKHLDHIYPVIMDELKDRLEGKVIPLSTIKWVSEEIESTIFDNVLGLHDTIFFGRRADLEAVRKDEETFRKPWKDLTKEQAKQLDKLGITLWDLFNLNDLKKSDELRFNGIPFYGKENRPGKIHSLFHGSKAKKLQDMIRKKLIKRLNNGN